MSDSSANSLSPRQRLGLELWRSYRHNQTRLHPLRSLFWECTLRCNMNCRHCGSDCRAVAQTPDMPAADFLRVIDSLTPHVDPHQTFIIVTGGEPLLRNDLEEVGLALYRRGYPWGMVTNGFLLSDSRMDSLMRAGLHSMTVSIDGFQPEHDWIRRHPDAFAHASDAIRRMAAQPELLWDVVTCVNPRTYPYLADFKEYLISLGVRRWRIFSIFPVGRAADDPELQLADSQLRGILDFIRDCRLHDPRIDVSYACEGFLGSYEQQVRDQWFHCRAGVEVASVLCDGSISGCTSIRSHMYQGNIYRDDLWDVWQHRFQPMRDRSWARRGQCEHCRSWRYCEGSGLHLYDESGRLLTCHYQRILGGE